MQKIYIDDLKSIQKKKKLQKKLRITMFVIPKLYPDTIFCIDKNK